MRKSVGEFTGFYEPSSEIGGQAPENICDCTLSTFNLRLFPGSLRGLKKDQFCTYKDNATRHFEARNEIFSF